MFKSRFSHTKTKLPKSKLNIGGDFRKFGPRVGVKIGKMKTLRKRGKKIIFREATNAYVYLRGTAADTCAEISKNRTRLTICVILFYFSCISSTNMTIFHRTSCFRQKTTAKIQLQTQMVQPRIYPWKLISLSRTHLRAVINQASLSWTLQHEMKYWAFGIFGECSDMTIESYLQKI